ncbi:threonine dehydratase [Methanoculleus chikugoensis]|jgi:ACT domain-containing protein|uniref:Threonine dehydratase n=1 Tax=Methanoculleus chikugoensis TaxID=118126 RepID=A0A1M4MK17_9EURY|nr:amino acid-binding protein [Methanoculleus chikugoensis]NMA09414.1 amino acid-binding protein [Methanomicrobiales archaeon]SCL75233.1 threonine dehydratase [Methanoculleus chikugoensis]
MKLEMRDRPGQLVAALQPISAVGGNIIAVIHQRETPAATEALDVQIVLELPEGRLSRLLELLREQGVNVVRIDEERLLYECTLIMIGHLMHTDLSDTVGRIDTTGSAEVTELSLVMPAISSPSSARITIRSTTRTEMKKAIRILRSVAEQKNLLIIEPLEDT